MSVRTNPGACAAHQAPAVERPLSRRAVLNGMGALATAAAIPATRSAAASRSCNFLVVGDWGRDGAFRQREVAIQMGKAAELLGCRHVVSVGDNFYENGVESTSDAQWRSSFEQVYRASSLQIPWYVALGNHDYRGNPQAQIDYTDRSERWRMPRRYYKVTARQMDAPHLELFVIDTTPMVRDFHDSPDGRIAANIANQDVPAQLRWLDRELAVSTAPWKIVIGHHTIHSGGGAHGGTPEVATLVEPLLQKHRVQAYINGHDHDLQHVRSGGVNYIGCGAGSQVRPVQAIEGTMFCASRSGFAAIESALDSLTLQFRDFTGAMLYKAVIPRINMGSIARLEMMHG